MSDNDMVAMEWLNSQEGMNGMPLEQYRAMKTQSQQLGLPGVGTGPAVRESPLPAGMLGPMANSAAMYGPMPVAQPMLDILNARFGWNPSGIANGRPVTAPQAYAVPPIAYPDVAMPPLTGRK